MAREMRSDEIDELLDEQYVARLGCRSGDEIYVVPVAYARDGRAIHVFSYEGRKLEMMRREPRVCVEIDDIEHFGRWRSVIGWGKFEELAGEDRARAKALLARRLEPEIFDSISKKRLEAAMADDPAPVVFRIRLETITGRAEG
ncbi:MAG: pyridoxamine 5'-phosphate oxidase family protein [Thermoanaerobaculia bacterium]|nr:pyridoxamine 5'-phosphate oxidase family protein [Thermoanaerobaculia bacterium]